MSTLYVAPGACSLGAQVVVRELNLPIEIVKVTLRNPDSIINRINPLARVPSLTLDNDVLLTENAAILPYLGDLAPEGNLFAPVGTVERSIIQSWIGFGATELHAGGFRIVNRGASWVTDPAAQAELKEHGKTYLRKSFEHINRSLQGKTWLTGERFTIADAYIGVFIRWLTRFGNEFDDLVEIKRFREAYEARPSVIAALQFEASNG